MIDSFAKLKAFLNSLPINDTHDYQLGQSGQLEVTIKALLILHRYYLSSDPQDRVDINTLMLSMKSEIEASCGKDVAELDVKNVLA